MTQITKGFSDAVVLSWEETEVQEEHSYNGSAGWLGNSCGIRYRTTDDDAPIMSCGIVVYLTKKFEETTNEEQYINHVQTKKGVLTICGMLKNG